MNIKKISPWKVAAGTLILLSIPTLFVFLLERYTTSDEHFCMTCHYKMWGEDFLVHSNIHPDSVRCPQCHANHKDFIPKDFSAHPERINPNCVRCHGEMFKKTDMKGFKYNVMNIYMPHKFHLQDVGALCTDCHLNIKHDKLRPITNRPRMEACLECHDQETTPCSKCHQRGASEVIAALPKADVINRTDCEKCHADFASKPITFYQVEFPHDRHLKQGLICKECHSNAKIHGEIVKSREICMQCHHKDIKKECIECHAFENQFRNGLALEGIKGEADPMVEIVTCDVCHAKISEGHNKKDVLAACSMCHKDAGFEKRVDEIQKKTDDSIQELEKLLEAKKKVVYDIPDVSQKEMQPVIDQGEKILQTLKKDRSRGFHNAAYSSLLVKNARDILEKAALSKGDQEK
ncbi:MAG: hypothetical protein COT35_06435 [Nitrospirae bacterium CG08_land_8_20_14_0_20_52_24]|nr:MAG: hypothetical protein COT35_06435 [Nitrospirae bacterium CG08_land_8_20_14_0_20_52_24]PIV82308.1 MAG: hypothetical protein COW52_14325 [Nitrospirae bacterium CG17_big_fil_post_rev_8_21_14_2_50_50_9]PIW84960.1 MAG: hypothetical protein COZ95_07085 [Nitrospirae bacterium CG_4_8_14_3_um_filter_50_41]PIX84812.1 MAG: hypothetical protein COZ32_11645 [Nitrospirae bacterium CG_4_10_14_3_um_filter_53_41]